MCYAVRQLISLHSLSPLVSCSYDVVLVDGEAEIIRKFLEFDAKAVFSAEGFCWPDQSLAVRGLQVCPHRHSRTDTCMCCVALAGQVP